MNQRKKTTVLLLLLALTTLFSVAAAIYYHQTGRAYRLQVQELKETLQAVQLEISVATPAAAPATSAVPMEPDLKQPPAEQEHAGIPHTVHQAELTEKDLRIQALEARVTQLQTASTNRPPRDPRQWMERLKEENPEKYRQVQNRISEAGRRATDTLARQSAFMLNLDPELMSEEQRSAHEELTALYEQTWNIMSELFDQENPRAGRETWMALGGTMREMKPLLEVQRTALLQDLGRQMGFTTGEADELQQIIDEIYRMTDTGSIWRSMRGGFSSLRGPNDR